MMKNNRNQRDITFGLKLTVVIVGFMFLFYGKKEVFLYRQLEQKVLQEQRNHQAVEKKPVQEKETAEEDALQETAPQVREMGEEQTGQKMIRVMLTDSLVRGYEHKALSLQGAGGLVVTGAVEKEYADHQVVNVEEILQEGQIQVRAKEEGGTITVSGIEKDQGIPSYEGLLEITRTSQGFYVINELDLETYLKYVVPSEMPAGYPLEALKAQAVCARTYAVSQIKEGRLKEYQADVDDTVSFQVYNNIPRQAATDQAVEETRGKIMCYQGKPVQAYFFSTSCGYTSTDEVWDAKEAAPYLKSISVSTDTMEVLADGRTVEHPFSEEAFRGFICSVGADDYEKEDPWYRWKITFPVERIQEKITREYPEVGTVQGFYVKKRSGGGAVKELELVGAGGRRSICNEYEIREFFSPEDIPVFRGDGTKGERMELLPSGYFVIDPVVAGEQITGFVLTGGGYGHGVGMSQNGARHMGENGAGWEEILQTFYRDISFEDQYSVY